ncbi:hypothetical protein HDU67_009775 [Dinochytrium kinnereticum]|nr:hypothetical protein HDU67_009775 [Dinochytrium kinnereticum]
MARQSATCTSVCALSGGRGFDQLERQPVHRGLESGLGRHVVDDTAPTLMHSFPIHPSSLTHPFHTLHAKPAPLTAATCLNPALGSQRSCSHLHSLSKLHPASPGKGTYTSPPPSPSARPLKDPPPRRDLEPLARVTVRVVMRLLAVRFQRDFERGDEVDEEVKVAVEHAAREACESRLFWKWGGEGDEEWSTPLSSYSNATVAKTRWMKKLHRLAVVSRRLTLLRPKVVPHMVVYALLLARRVLAIEGRISRRLVEEPWSLLVVCVMLAEVHLSDRQTSTRVWGRVLEGVDDGDWGVKWMRKDDGGDRRKVRSSDPPTSTREGFYYDLGAKSMKKDDVRSDTVTDSSERTPQNRHNPKTQPHHGQHSFPSNHLDRHESVFILESLKGWTDDGPQIMIQPYGLGGVKRKREEEGDGRRDVVELKREALEVLAYDTFVGMDEYAAWLRVLKVVLG